MVQSLFPGIHGKILALILFVGALAGCDRSAPEDSTATRITVASLVPAATDLLIEMGEGEKLVAVSDYDSAKINGKTLPKVGAYQNTDWEKLASLKPSVMIIQMDPARMPAEFSERVKSLGIKLVNVKIDRLKDIFTAIDQIGDSIGSRQKSDQFATKLRGQLDQVKERVKGKPPVLTVLVHNATGTDVIGPDNFMDEMLTLAGGKNAVGGTVPWPTIDREKLIAMNPEVILQLLPDAPPQVVGQAKESWAALKELTAVKNNRVQILTDWFVLQPGGHVGQLAGMMADRLHPETATSRPVSRLSPLPGTPGEGGGEGSVTHLKRLTNSEETLTLSRAYTGEGAR